MIEINKNLLNDKLLNSKISIEDMEENQPIKNYFISKISNLKNDIKFLKFKDIHDQTIIAQLNEQKNNMIETIKQLKNIDIPSKLSSMKNNIILNEPDRDDEIKKDEKEKERIRLEEEEKIKKWKEEIKRQKEEEEKREIELCFLINNNKGNKNLKKYNKIYKVFYSFKT